jgi:hypothetical protein
MWNFVNFHFIWKVKIVHSFQMLRNTWKALVSQTCIVSQLRLFTWNIVKLKRVQLCILSKYQEALKSTLFLSMHCEPIQANCLKYSEAKSLNAHSFEMSRAIWKVLFSSNLHYKPTWAIYLEYYEVWFYQIGQMWNDYLFEILREMKNGEFALETCFSEMLCQTLR